MPPSSASIVSSPRSSRSALARPLAALLLAALAPAVAPRLAAQDGGAPAKAPGPHVRLSVDRFEFGSVPPGTTVHGTLTIESTGDAALLLSRIGVQCECAKLHLSTAGRPNVPIDSDDSGRTDLTLAPGEKATLEIRVDTTKLAIGAFTKRCLIFCSDAEKSPLSVPFSLDVEKPKPPPAPSPQSAGVKAPETGVAPRVDPNGEDEERRPPPTPVLTSGPPGKIEVDNYVHCFGETFRGEKLNHTFKLKNSGTGDLTIQEIRNSCSCTAAKLKIGDKTLTQEEIKRSKNLGTLKPGETADLEVELKTATAAAPGHDLPIKKFVRIFSNDPTNSSLALSLEATMVTPFTLDPVEIDFGRVKHGVEAVSNTLLGAGKLGDLKILAVKSPNEEFLQVKCEKVEGTPTPTYRIEAKLLACAPLGAFNNRIELDIDHERVKEISIPMRAIVEPYVSFVGNSKDGSDRIDFGQLQGDQDVTAELVITNGDPKIPYVLKSVTVDAKPSSDAFKTEIVEAEKGVKYVVKLVAPKSLSKSRFFQGSLELSADHPDVPVKRITFRGWFKQTNS
jgi:hypothetical protein